MPTRYGAAVNTGELLGIAALGVGVGAVVLSQRKSGTPPVIGPTAPPAPTGLAASALIPSADGQTFSLNLSWNASTGADTYVPDVNGNALPATSGLSAPVTGLAPSSTFVFAVAGVNSVGTGPLSNTVTVNTPAAAAPVPAAPTGLVASNVTPTSVELDCNASTGATGYTPYENGVALTAVGTPSVIVTGLKPGTTYQFAMDAFNASGHSAPSGAITVTTALSAPPVPTGLAASNITATSVDLDCNPSAGAADYIFQEDGTSLAAVTTPSITVTGLTPQTQYQFSVAAKDAAGTSAQSAVITVTTGPATTPANFTITISALAAAASVGRNFTTTKAGALAATLTAAPASAAPLHISLHSGNTKGAVIQTTTTGKLNVASLPPGPYGITVVNNSTVAINGSLAVTTPG